HRFSCCRRFPYSRRRCSRAHNYGYRRIIPDRRQPRRGRECRGRLRDARWPHDREQVSVHLRSVLVDSSPRWIPNCDAGDLRVEQDHDNCIEISPLSGWAQGRCAEVWIGRRPYSSYRTPGARTRISPGAKQDLRSIQSNVLRDGLLADVVYDVRISTLAKRSRAQPLPGAIRSHGLRVQPTDWHHANLVQPIRFHGPPASEVAPGARREFLVQHSCFRYHALSGRCWLLGQADCDRRVRLSEDHHGWRTRSGYCDAGFDDGGFQPWVNGLAGNSTWKGGWAFLATLGETREGPFRLRQPSEFCRSHSAIEVGLIHNYSA